MPGAKLDALGSRQPGDLRQVHPPYADGQRCNEEGPGAPLFQQHSDHHKQSGSLQPQVLVQAATGLNTPTRPCPERFLAMSEAVPGLCPGEQSLSQTEESTSRADNNLFDHVGEQVVFG